MDPNRTDRPAPHLPAGTRWRGAAPRQGRRRRRPPSRGDRRRLRARRRLAGGETGAHEVRGPHGARLVVKWRARSVVPSRAPDRGGTDDAPARRRMAGPRAVGDRRRRLHLRAPGVPARTPRRGVLPRAGRRAPTCTHAGGGSAPTSSARADRAPRADARHRWRRVLRPRVAPRLRRSHRRAAGSDRGHGSRARSRGPEGDDVVHWDLHPGNLLQVDGRLCAVVDNDFAAVGDGRFDLVTLVIAGCMTPCDAGVRDRLAAAAFDDLDPVRRDPTSATSCSASSTGRFARTASTRSTSGSTKRIGCCPPRASHSSRKRQNGWPAGSSRTRTRSRG